MRTERKALRANASSRCGFDRLIAAAVLSLLLAPVRSVAAEGATCAQSLAPRVVVQLLFGRGMSHGGSVTGRQWRSFVADELTPRFPDGLTMLDANGRWRDPKRGVIIAEASKVVEIVLPGDKYEAEKIDAAIDAYKRRFRMQSVGLIVQTACVRF